MSSAGQIVGGAVGFFLGGPLGIGAAMGAQAGIMLGGLIDPPKQPTIHGPRLNDLSVQTSTTDAPIPRIYGTMATFGNIIWVEGDRLKESVKKTKSGGKGGGGQTTKTYSYSATFAVGLCKGPIAGVRRIWVGARLIYDAGSEDLEAIIASNQAASGFKIYLGDETQLPNPRMQADKGVSNTPGYRGLAYIVFYDLGLAEYGNSLMGAQVKVEVVKVATVATPTYIGPAVAMVGKVVHSEDGIVTTASQGDQFFFTGPDGFRYYSGAVLYRQYSRYAQIKTYTLSQTILVQGVTQSFSFFKSAPVSNTPDEMFVCRTPAGSKELRFNWSEDYFVHNLDTEDFSKDYYKSNDGLYIFPANSYLAVFNGSSFSTRTYANPTYGRSSYQGSKFAFDRATGKTYCMLNTNNSGWQDLIELDDNADLVNFWSYNFGSAQRHFYVYADRWAVNPANILSVYDRVGDTWVAQGSLAKGASDVHYFGEGVALSADGLWKIDDNQTGFLVGLGDIVQSETLQSQLITPSDINTSNLTDQVRGYRVATPSAIRADIEPLQLAWPFDVVQRGYKLHFIRRPKTNAATVTEIIGKFKVDREMDIQLLREVALKYVEADREYDVSQQIAKRENTDAINRKDIDLPIVMTASEALQKAEILLYMWWLERYDLTFKLPPIYNNLEASDVITINTEFGTYEVRLTEVTYNADGTLDCKAKYNSANVYTSDAVADTGTSQGSSLQLSGPTLYQVVDMPLVADALDGPGLFMMASGYTTGWPGGTVIRSSDNGATWDEIQGFTQPCAMGFARGTIGAATSAIVDTTSSLQVDMVTGQLESVDHLQLLAGANAFAYGADGRWEIIFAQNCVLQGDGSYILTDFLRGRAGTERNMANHAAGDALISLTDPDIAFVPMNTAQIGISKLYRGITIGRTIDTDTDKALTYHGVNLKPLAPVYLNGHRHPSTNDWTLTWIRRGRVSPEWRDLVDVPVGEETQAFEIEVWNSAYTTLYRTLTAATPTVNYTSAQQVTDFGSNQSTLHVRIFQMSASVGRGFPLQTSITR